MEERFFFSPVVQRCLVVAAKDLSLPPASMVKVSDLVESFLTSMAVAFKPEAPAQTLSFSDVERCLRSLFSSDALSEAEKEGAAALSAYVSAGTQVGRERAELQAELEDFTIIGDSMAESEFLSDERETELPITAALIQQRLIGAGVLSEKAPDKSAAIYIAGVLEFVVTKWLSFAARSARSRGDLELLEADLVHALHTDMQSTLLPFLTRALQQATPSSSVMSVSLLQAEDPPSNDNAPSFILEGPSDAVLRQRSSMSTFVVDEYEPSSPLLATRTPTPPSLTPPPLDAADTVQETPPPPPTPPLPEAPLTTTATVPPASPSLKEAKRHTDRMWLLALAALITVIAYSLISQLLPTRLQG